MIAISFLKLVSYKFWRVFVSAKIFLIVNYMTLQDFAETLSVVSNKDDTKETPITNPHIVESVCFSLSQELATLQKAYS